jgi:putative oxygen-independent coproporphyrinogen III oxidase
MVIHSDAPGFGLYIHWPFCLAKCPYCDFNSHVREQIDAAAWHAALLRELDYWGEQTKGRALSSIFFGGGTPSLMPPDTVAALIEKAKHYWLTDEQLEVTLEANPTSVEAAKFAAFRQAGVNRVSVGIQALREADLKALGRQHDVGQAQRALELAALHFPRFSFDLIYAREGQSVAQWREELNEALQYGAQHMSLYQLTIEPGTQFATLHQRGDLKIPDEDTGAALYELTQELCEAKGLPTYEISNHAAPGQECRHNLTYWHYGDYVGIGPGAHGRVTLGDEKLATRTHRAPEEWLKRVGEHGHGLTEQTAVPKSEQLDEFLLMGLRTRTGISRTRLRREFGGDVDKVLRADKLPILQKHGLIELSEISLRATAEGRVKLNALLAELAA